MRSFKIPYGKILPDKIIEGILTPKEGLYAGSILILFSILFIFDDSYMGGIRENINFKSIIIRLIILIIYSSIITAFIFIKKDIYDLDQWLLLKIKFKNRNKKIVCEKY